MADITAEDLAALVGSANELVQTFENKEADIDTKINALSQSVTNALSGDYKQQIIYVDALNGDDVNSGASSSPLKSLSSALVKTSSLFSRCIIHLRGDYEYIIDRGIDSLEGKTIHIVGVDANTASSIRSGATDNRPSISIDIGDITAGDGNTVSAVSQRNGLFSGLGLNILFQKIRYVAPQGFDGDTDKSIYFYGPRLVMWQDCRLPKNIAFDQCDITYGLGGVIAVVGTGVTNIGLSDCDLRVNLSAENTLCRYFAHRHSDSNVNYSELGCVFYDASSGLPLTEQQGRESVFNHHKFVSVDSDAISLGISSYKPFTRTTIGLV